MLAEDGEERVDVFFYGLFMDEAVLRGKGLKPRGRRVASVENYRLHIGARATLAPRTGATVHGVVFSLTRGEVEALYSDESVSAYRPEVVGARLAEGGEARVLCYNLPAPPPPGERNPEYASKLRELAGRTGLPPDYVASIV
ncbi:MAG TPA: gamma-glutamylcyclotransferase family protein [Pyrinomonadaceae bacterium]